MNSTEGSSSSSKEDDGWRMKVNLSRSFKSSGDASQPIHDSFRDADPGADTIKLNFQEKTKLKLRARVEGGCYILQAIPAPNAPAADIEVCRKLPEKVLIHAIQDVQCDTDTKANIEMALESATYPLTICVYRQGAIRATSTANMNQRKQPVRRSVSSLAHDFLARKSSSNAAPSNVMGEMNLGDRFLRPKITVAGHQQKQMMQHLTLRNCLGYITARSGMTESNWITTQQYTWVSWIPMSLFLQFKRNANIYFALVCILTMTEYTTKPPISFVTTFAGVLLVQSIKNGYEDLYLRRKSDKRINQTPCLLFSHNGWEPSVWAKIVLGDVVRVECDEQVPCDMIILATSCPNSEFGVCYVDTKSLDGETNLKPKRANNLMQHAFAGLGLRNDPDGYSKSLDSLQTLAVRADCPSEHLHIFNASFVIKNHRETGIFLENSVFRCCTLRNTEWMVGFAVYVGVDTKVTLNSRDPPDKMPNMQYVLNKTLYSLFLLLFVISLLAAILEQWWLDGYNAVGKHCYLLYLEKRPNDVQDVIEKFLGFIVAFSHLIPVSLYVALGFLKLILSHDMSRDKNMTDDGISCLTKSTELIEEVGQVEYIFSDKTGTLTCNLMEFIKCSVNGTIYDIKREGGRKDNKENQDDFDRLILEQHGHAADPTGKGEDNEKNPILDILQKPKHQEFERLNQFFTLLALCHTCVPSQRDGYQGTSPDEVALVKGAKMSGVEFVEKKSTSRDGNCVKLKLGSGLEKTYRVLNILEFTSERKCMSVVVEELDVDPDIDDSSSFENVDTHNNTASMAGGVYREEAWLKPNSKIFLMVKGADSVIEKLLVKKVDSSTDLHCSRFSKDGLRILMCAQKQLDVQFYKAWSESYRGAKASLKCRAEKMESTVQQLESTGLNLVGISAIEDRLQEGVPESIEIIRKAGVMFWMLTGDKVETAIDIGYSCKLVTHDMILSKLSNLSTKEALLEEIVKRMTKLDFEGRTRDSHCIAIDGTSVMYLTESEECRQKFYQLCQRSIACICCRLAPKQKAFLVNFVRKTFPNDPITLAIGDGANDVAMIQEAHVGVGVRGKEGSQAVQASDYAISQFRFLVPLLLSHGRMGYRRVSTFMCYYFYKNIALCFGDVIWIFFSGFSGQIMYPDWLTTCFNGMWTSFPAFVVFAVDSDVPDLVCRKNAYLYRAGPQRTGFNSKVFWVWVSLAIFHGCMSQYIPVQATGSWPMNSDGMVHGLWWSSLLSFTIIVFVVTWKLILITLRWVKWNVGIIVFSVLFFASTIVGLSERILPWILASVMQREIWGLPIDMAGNGLAWIYLFLVVACCLLPDVLVEYIKVNVEPTPLEVQMYNVRQRKEATAELQDSIRIAPTRPPGLAPTTPAMRMQLKKTTVAPGKHI